MSTFILFLITLGAVVGMGAFAMLLEWVSEC